MITRNMTLREISETTGTMKEFFRYLIVEGTEEEWNSPLSMFGQETCDMAAEALNHIQDSAEKGISWKLDIDDSDEDKLFYFPGKKTLLTFCSA